MLVSFKAVIPGKTQQSVIGTMLLARLGDGYNAMVGVSFRCVARNSVGQVSGGVNDITMAKEQGYIVADASGMVGFTADRTAQRDVGAKKVRDKTGTPGASDEN